MGQTSGLSYEEIEEIARRLVDLIRAEDAGAVEQGGQGELVDAAKLAQRLGVSRATVYAKADELGAIRLGTGRRARLRFDPRRFAADGSSGSRTTQDRSSTRSAPLLPIRPPARRRARPRRGRS